MANLVSSRLDYYNQNAQAPISFPEVQHELQHLKQREQAASLGAIGLGVLGILMVAGVIWGGAFIAGAIFAIAAFAAIYAYFCRLAEVGLREKTFSLIAPQQKNQVELQESTK